MVTPVNHSFCAYANHCDGDETDSYSRNYLLQPNDALFKSMASKYYQVLIQQFGSDHFYNSDTYVLAFFTARSSLFVSLLILLFLL
jgi:hypothetical protein